MGSGPEPSALCIHPTIPGAFWVGDTRCVRLFQPNLSHESIAWSGDGNFGLWSVVAGSMMMQPSFADGQTDKARFNGIYGIAAISHYELLISDFNNCRIRWLNRDQVTTIAGDGKAENRDGKGTAAGLDNPRNICFLRKQQTGSNAITTAFDALYITTWRQIRRLALSTGTGPGPAPCPPVRRCLQIVLYASAYLFLFCLFCCWIAGAVTTLALSLESVEPWALASTGCGMLIGSCRLSRRVFAANPESGAATWIAGTGRAGREDGDAFSEAQFEFVSSIAVNDSEQSILVTDRNNNAVRQICLWSDLFAKS